MTLMRRLLVASFLVALIGLSVGCGRIPFGADAERAKAEAEAQQAKAEAEVAKAKAEVVASREAAAEADRRRAEAEAALAKSDRSRKEGEIERFAGRWRIVDEKGATSFILTLGKSLDAQKSHVPNATGTWEIVGDEVRITWSDGWRDVLRPEKDGVIKAAIGPGAAWNDPPANTERAIKDGVVTVAKDKAAGRVADLKAMLLAAQQEEEQAKKQATQARAEADKATQKAAQDDRVSRAAQAAQAGSTDAQSRIQAYKDVLETSGRAAKSTEEAKQLVEKAKKAEAKVKQATIAVSEARADLRQAESDLLKAQLAPQ